MSVSVIIGGDTVPTEENFADFATGNPAGAVDARIIDIVAGADLSFFNLEVPLTDREAPIIKGGPNLKAPADCAKGLKAMGIDIAGLANNHTLDHGDGGLFDTFAALEAVGIQHVGAGKNLKDAAKPLIVEKNGKKIGFYNCAEHEFTIAEDDKPGANPIDLVECWDHIANLKKACDFVFVIYHGGKEYYRYPSPNVQKICRKMVDKGADAVICQHSHCIGAKEEYNGKTIVYGEGNFLFASIKVGNPDWAKCWQSGLLTKFEIGDTVRTTFIPVLKTDNGVCLAEGDAAKEILDDFEKRSLEIQKPGFVQENYRTFSMSFVHHYSYMLNATEPFSQERYDAYVQPEYTVTHLLGLKNLITCEAHSELFMAAINQMLEQ